ncbi:hypothetical protein Tco_0521080 [Tanacetum coccineum]
MDEKTFHRNDNNVGTIKEGNVIEERQGGGTALEQMPKYANFMKDLLTNKAKFEETSMITLNERCSAVLLNKIPFQERDPESFTIPCVIGKLVIDKALADLGASISLMPYSVFISCAYDVLESSGYARSGIHHYAFLVLRWR